MVSITSIEDIRLSPRAAKFEGGDDIPVSMFITQYARGEGPDQHTHPYAEAFVVQAGTARFLVDGESIDVRAGNVVVVPPETAHGFKNPGDEQLRVVSVHPSPAVVQTDLE
ncbi:MAG TPA: cupin domain-containing protein [Solirubrobacteraceae bacterium]